MNQTIKYIFITVFILLIAFLGIGYLSSYIGWYGYKKWELRKHSNSINESITRNTFIKKLNYKIYDFDGIPFKFEPFIEKGFKWGHNTSEQTILLTESEFPYQLSYNYRPNKEITILMRDDQFKKFDSLGWALTNPQLPDTIILKIGGEGIKSGIIKVW